jgi:flagellar biosynthesis protein
MVDTYDDGREITPKDKLTPLNTRKIPGRKTAVALDDGVQKGELPRISAAGRGKIAEKILQLAQENGVRIRRDKDLTEMLAQIELDSPIPSEAFMAVAEILSYVYRANGQPNPFDVAVENAAD